QRRAKRGWATAPDRNDAFHRPLDPGRRGSLAQMTEHQRCRENHSDRVGNVLTGNVRGSSVHRFKNRVAPSEVGARNDTETADEAGTEIRDDVTIKIFQQQDVELTRLQDELHTRIVDNHLAVLDT